MNRAVALAMFTLHYASPPPPDLGPYPWQDARRYAPTRHAGRAQHRWLVKHGRLRTWRGRVVTPYRRKRT